MTELREAEDRPPHMIALVDMVETVTGTFGELPGEPIWRIEFDGYCADFDYSEAANNFANAINEACLVALLSAHPVEAEALEWEGPAIEWLRALGKQNPPETLWHAASILADRLEARARSGMISAEKEVG